MDYCRLGYNQSGNAGLSMGLDSVNGEQPETLYTGGIEDMDMKYVLKGEDLKLFKQAIKAVSNNDWKAAKEIYKKLPLSPETALTLKERWGTQFLIDGAFNLAWAEDKYGKNWLEK